MVTVQTPTGTAARRREEDYLNVNVISATPVAKL